MKYNAIILILGIILVSFIAYVAYNEANINGYLPFWGYSSRQVEKFENIGAVEDTYSKYEPVFRK